MFRPTGAAVAPPFLSPGAGLVRAAARYLVRPADPDASPDACPLLLSMVAAGFPSPAEDYVEGPLNLHAHMVSRPAATFFVRASGESMTGAGIRPGDLLVVDRSIRPTPGRVVIAEVGPDLTVKRFRRDGSGVWLESTNPRFPPIRPAEGQELRVWGVVTFVVHKV